MPLQLQLEALLLCMLHYSADSVLAETAGADPPDKHTADCYSHGCAQQALWTVAESLLGYHLDAHVYTHFISDLLLATYHCAFDKLAAVRSSSETEVVQRGVACTPAMSGEAPGESASPAIAQALTERSDTIAGATAVTSREPVVKPSNMNSYVMRA